MTEYKELSPADWFRRNASIAGFDNPVRALYTAIRELVENSLDAAEERQIPPDIFVWVSEVEENVYRVFVSDNGIGVPEKDVPRAFAKLLVGTKYTLKQSRGTFGLGGKMAIMYGQISTGKPVRVFTSTDGKVAHNFLLKINIQKNEPIVLNHKKIELKQSWIGTNVTLHIMGDWARAKRKVIQYFKNTGIVAPYANILFVDPDGILYYFRRTTEKIPPQPKEVKPHPYGVDLETLNRMIASTKSRTLLDFLTKNFHRVGRTIAKKFLNACNLPPKKKPTELTESEKQIIVRKMQSFKFLPPTSESLSPLGPELLKQGIEKELHPEVCVTTQRPPASYMGHPFIVEVGLAYGGRIPSTPQYLLYRFANRIPLLYDESNDVAMKVITQDIKWGDYLIRKESPLAIIIHICSTKIPYKTAGKEYVADIPEIRHEIKLGIQECARTIRTYLRKMQKKHLAERRFHILSRYIDKFVDSLVAINKTDAINKREYVDPDYLKNILINKIKANVGD